MPCLNLQLYGRAANDDFNEQLTVRETVELRTGPTTVTLSLPASKDAPILELRLDPDDKPSTLILDRLNVTSSDGKELYNWDGTLKSLNALSNIKAQSLDGRVVFECLNDDPSLLIPLKVPQTGTVSVELGVSRLLVVGSAEQAAQALAHNAERIKFAETMLFHQHRCHLILTEVAGEIEGLQDAVQVDNAGRRRDSEIVGRRLAELIQANDRLERATELLTTDFHAWPALIEQTLTSLGLNEQIARLGQENRALRRSLESSIPRTVRGHTAELSTAILAVSEALADRKHADGDRHGSIVKQLDKIIAGDQHLEEQTTRLQERSQHDTRAIVSTLKNLRVQEQFDLLHGYIRTEAETLSSIMNSDLGAASSELWVKNQREFRKLAAQLDNMNDTSQLLERIRGQLNVSKNQDIFPKLQAWLEDIREMRERIAVMEATVGWRLSRYFANFLNRESTDQCISSSVRSVNTE